jgi:hypothetical protein
LRMAPAQVAEEEAQSEQPISGLAFN